MKRTNNNENTNFENGIFRNDRERDDSIDNSFEISYTEHDGLLYPDFLLPDQAQLPCRQIRKFTVGIHKGTSERYLHHTFDAVSVECVSP